MAVVVIELLTPATSLSSSVSTTRVIDVVHTTDAPINTKSGEAVVEVVGPGRVQNAIVSATPPAQPYEGQIWVDIS